MNLRVLAFAATLFVLSTAAPARADDAPHVRPMSAKETTGIVLTSVGGSLVLSAPVVFMITLAAMSSSPYDAQTVVPAMFLGTAAGAAIGLGLLVPGIVMLATCRHSKEAVPVLPETRQPAWTDARPIARGGPRTFTLPIFHGTF